MSEKRNPPRILPPLAFVLLLAASAAPLPVASHAPAAPERQKGVGRAEAARADAAPRLKRTNTRREVRRMGYGGKLTIYGAPQGSIEVEAWPRREVEIVAEVELSADTEEELARLARVNGFLVEDDVNHVRLITLGTHDRQYVKRAARDLPKKLLAMPWRITYRVRVPEVTDLEIMAGGGPLTITGVEGTLRLNAGQAETVLTFTGGDVEATIAGGPVTLRVPARSWRGRGLSLRLVSGDVTVELPQNFSGDVNAEVLRAGSIQNSHAGLLPRERTAPTDRLLQARGGEGGAVLSFTVGDGTLRIKPASQGQ